MSSQVNIRDFWGALAVRVAELQQAAVDDVTDSRDLRTAAIAALDEVIAKLPDARPLRNYEVEFTFTWSETVEVEARSEDEAHEKLEDAIIDYHGSPELYSGDIEVSDITDLGRIDGEEDDDE